MWGQFIIELIDIKFITPLTRAGLMWIARLRPALLSYKHGTRRRVMAGHWRWKLFICRKSFICLANSFKLLHSNLYTVYSVFIFLNSKLLAAEKGRLAAFEWRRNRGSLRKLPHKSPQAKWSKKCKNARVWSEDDGQEREMMGQEKVVNVECFSSLSGSFSHFLRHWSLSY